MKILLFIYWLIAGIYICIYMRDAKNIVYKTAISNFMAAILRNIFYMIIGWADTPFVIFNKLWLLKKKQ